jgi:hypothetical protein
LREGAQFILQGFIYKMNKVNQKEASGPLSLFSRTVHVYTRPDM